MLSSWSLQSGTGLRLVHRYRFLFHRFKPECFYYGLFLLYRNGVIALLPAVLVEVPQFQIPIATAYKHKINTVPLVCEGFRVLNDDGLQVLPSLWSPEQKQVLANYGISLEDVNSSYRWLLHELSPLKMHRFGPVWKRDVAAVELLVRCGLPMSATSAQILAAARRHNPRGARILITSCITDAEALSTCEDVQASPNESESSIYLLTLPSFESPGIDLDLQVFLLAISDAVQLKFVQSTAMAWRPKKILLDGRCLCVGSCCCLNLPVPNKVLAQQSGVDQPKSRSGSGSVKRVGGSSSRDHSEQWSGDERSSTNSLQRTARLVDISDGDSDTDKRPSRSLRCTFFEDDTMHW
eukprot:g6096.t1